LLSRQADKNVKTRKGGNEIGKEFHSQHAKILNSSRHSLYIIYNSLIIYSG
jgi:hypothetical protein